MMRSVLKAVLLLTFCVAFLFGTIAAKADTLNFTLNDTTNGDTYSWQLDRNPVPDGFVLNDNFFFNSVATIANGSPASLCGLTFYSTSDGGGLAADNPCDNTVFNIFGDQLYTGAEDAPRFLTGTFLFPGQSEGPVDDYSLTIASAPVSSVPEPATLTLLGIGMIGAFSRKKLRVSR